VSNASGKGSLMSNTGITLSQVLGVLAIASFFCFYLFLDVYENRLCQPIDEAAGNGVDRVHGKFAH